MPIDLTDADVFFSDFAETVAYRAAGGSVTRSIEAVVDRNPPAELDEAPGVRNPRIQVVVRNDAATGISADELDTGGDQLDVPVRVGGAAVTKNITKIIDQDAGLLRLEVV